MKLDRRRGFSNRMIAAMFIATVINFLSSSLSAGVAIGYFIVLIRKSLILDINYPPSEQSGLVNGALQNIGTVAVWAVTLPVSTKLSLSDPTSIHVGGGISQ